MEFISLYTHKSVQCTVGICKNIDFRKLLEKNIRFTMSYCDYESYYITTLVIYIYICWKNYELGPVLFVKSIAISKHGFKKYLIQEYVLSYCRTSIWWKKK